MRKEKWSRNVSAVQIKVGKRDVHGSGVGGCGCSWGHGLPLYGREPGFAKA